MYSAKKTTDAFLTIFSITPLVNKWGGGTQPLRAGSYGILRAFLL